MNEFRVLPAFVLDVSPAKLVQPLPIRGALHHARCRDRLTKSPEVTKTAPPKLPGQHGESVVGPITW